MIITALIIYQWLSMYFGCTYMYLIFILIQCITVFYFVTFILHFFIYSYNRISDVANYDLKSLLNLQELKLMANNIIDLQKGALRHLTGLQSLDLSRNRIEVLQFGQFAGLSGLRIVNLSHNLLFNVDI